MLDDKLKGLTLVKKNRFGNGQYSISDDSNLTKPDGEIWSIKDATPDMMEQYPDSILREYNGVTFLLSLKAAQVTPVDTPKEYTGCACILTVGNSFVLMADNKPYLQNCQGQKEEYENNPQDTMARELNEELGIICNPDRFKHIGHWTFLNNIELVDWELYSKTMVYTLECNASELSHITDNFIDFQIIEYQSDETEFVVVIPFGELEMIPEVINGKRFNSHHREALRRYLSLSPKYPIDYLNEFQIHMN